MMKKILIIGGYGNFGSYITTSLAREADLKIIVAGRSQGRAEQFIKELKDTAHPVDFFHMDVTREFSFAAVNPDIVIHTSGPYQGQGYDVAKACIEHGCHYLDLADGREFVTDIKDLHDVAQQKGITVISGASSVPCLSSAIVDHYKPEFDQLDMVDYGIATAQQTNRGLATTSGVLDYTGKAFTTMSNGKMAQVYGWQNLHFRRYPFFGLRALGNCDIPDLDLFPHAYPDVKIIRFYAGTEIRFLHVGLWLLSWLVRWEFIKSLRPAAGIFLKIANMFSWMGSSDSAFHMILSGLGRDGQDLTKTIYILAQDGHGPYIPCMPAIILAKRLARDEDVKAGAYPCMSIINFEDYMAGLSGLSIRKIEA